MNFHFEFAGPFNEEFGFVFAAVYTIVLLLVSVMHLALYILRGFGLYSIAKRRALNHPWLVWIPVAGNWMIGSFSDQYRYLVRGEIKSRRKLLLGFSVGNVVLNAFALILAVVCAGQLIFARGQISDGQMAAAMVGPVTAILILSCILSVMKLVEYVLRQMCMYDLYRSCDPGNATAYLVLGILFSVLEPIFLIAIRKKDDGIPPRRDRSCRTEPAEGAGRYNGADDVNSSDSE